VERGSAGVQGGPGLGKVELGKGRGRAGTLLCLGFCLPGHCALQVMPVVAVVEVSLAAAPVPDRCLFCPAASGRTTVW
jgi:hypothetical protein